MKLGNSSNTFILKNTLVVWKVYEMSRNRDVFSPKNIKIIALCWVIGSSTSSSIFSGHIHTHKSDPPFDLDLPFPGFVSHH